MSTPITKSTRDPSPPRARDASREETLSSREAAISARENAGHAREDAVALREAADHAREEAAACREAAVHAREEAAHVRSELDALMRQLREANEHLIVANLRSQTLAEEADQ